MGYVRTCRVRCSLGGLVLQSRKRPGFIARPVPLVLSFNSLAGTVHRIENGEMAVVTDDAELVRFRPKDCPEVALGYAGTIYKGQGKTLDDAYLLHTKHWRKDSGYVAMTRARHTTRVYAARFGQGKDDLEQLAWMMGRDARKHASLHFAAAASARRPASEQSLHAAWRAAGCAGQRVGPAPPPMGLALRSACEQERPLSRIKMTDGGLDR